MLKVPANAVSELSALKELPKQLNKVNLHVRVCVRVRAREHMRSKGKCTCVYAGG